MLSKAEYNLRKSALKRQYNEALANVSTADLRENKYVQESIDRMEARKALRGQGAYSMYTGHGAYSLGGSIGGAIGGMLGNKKLGRSLGRIGGRFLGVGSLNDTNYNQLFTGQSDLSPPSYASVAGEDGAICISHTEYVGNIYGNPSGSDFVNQTYDLNPALEESFPWLSQIAQNYDEYEFNQLVWQWYPTVTDNGVSSSGQVGNIMMVTNYNPAVEPFSTVQDFLAYTGNQSGIVTARMVHGVECDPDQIAISKHKFCRAGPLGTNEDIKTYDLGTFQIGLQGTPSNLANQLLGRMYVTYSVTLRKPKFFTGKGFGISRACFVSNGGASKCLISVNLRNN